MSPFSKGSLTQNLQTQIVKLEFPSVLLKSATAATAPDGVAMWKRDIHQSDSDCNLDYFMDEVVIAGNPTDVTHELLELRRAIGPFGNLVLIAHDWDDRDRWVHSLELFTREVVPAFNKAIGANEKC